MIGRIHHEDQGVGVGEVVAPERPQLGLATNIPVGGEGSSDGVWSQSDVR